jgi:hypothetical protein
MDSLTSVYEQIASRDADLEKQAAELIKEAEEQDAAGRITARGFADELAKLATPGLMAQKPSAPSVPSGGYQTGGGNMGGNFDIGSKRPGQGNAMAGRNAAPGNTGVSPGSAKAPAAMKMPGAGGTAAGGAAPGGPKPPAIASNAAPKPPKM